jgi:preprotein translocase subunit Sec61beta
VSGSRRDKSATESLLQIAVGLEIALVFFGALALNGLRLYPGVVVLVGSLVATAVLLVLYRVVAYPAGRVFGHMVQLALLGTFFWDVVMGISALVMLGFWIFGAIRGPQLDRLASD